MNNRIKFLIVAYIVGLFKLTSVIQGQKSPPNVILIYTDDHGYTDLGVLGIDINVDTPNMDKLARGGALMTAGYSTAPQCVPSRAGLMIGRVQNEFAFPHNGCDPEPRAMGFDHGRAYGIILLPKNGHGFSGKWHLITNHGIHSKRRTTK